MKVQIEKHNLEYLGWEKVRLLKMLQKAKINKLDIIMLPSQRMIKMKYNDNY